MKTSLFILSLTASSIAMAATAASTKDQPNTASASQPGAKASANPDGQVTATVLAANEAEVKIGKFAQTKATNPQVKAFAQHMVEEHSANTQQATALVKEIGVKPQPNDKVAEMKADIERQIAQVETKSGKEFDKAYIELQVAMHEQVLTQIETALLPMSQNPALKSFLQTTKTHVEQHLAQAKKIQSAL